MDHVYQLNDLRLTLECDPNSTGLNLSSSTTRSIYFKKPDGTVGSWSATLVGDSQLRVDIEDIALNSTGVWKVYAYVVDSGKIYQGDVAQFEVRKTWQVR